MIARAIDPENAYCWRCGMPLLDSQCGYGYGGGDGWGGGSGNGSGNGFGNGYGYGYGYSDGYGDGDGDPIPICDDPLACACGRVFPSNISESI